MSIPVPAVGKAEVSAAADIFAERLHALGIGNFTVDTGDLMTFAMAVPLTVHEATVDAVLRTPGVIQFVPWPANGQAPAPGAVVPEGLQPLFADPTEFKSGTLTTDASGQVALDITLGTIGREALATYTIAHIGDPLPLVLDGTVLTSPTIQTPITDGVIRLTTPSLAIEPGSITLAALAAIIASGPLPPAWR